jgi:small-conductance mechanosensitive channel
VSDDDRYSLREETEQFRALQDALRPRTEGADVSEYEQMEVIRLNKRISTLEHELKQSKAFHQAYTEPLIERIAQLEAALRYIESITDAKDSKIWKRCRAALALKEPT